MPQQQQQDFRTRNNNVRIPQHLVNGYGQLSTLFPQTFPGNYYNQYAPYAGGLTDGLGIYNNFQQGNYAGMGAGALNLYGHLNQVAPNTFPTPLPQTLPGSGGPNPYVGLASSGLGGFNAYQNRDYPGLGLNSYEIYNNLNQIAPNTFPGTETLQQANPYVGGLGQLYGVYSGIQNRDYLGAGVSGLGLVNTINNAITPNVVNSGAQLATTGYQSGTGYALNSGVNTVANSGYSLGGSSVASGTTNTIASGTKNAIASGTKNAIASGTTNAVASSVGETTVKVGTDAAAGTAGASKLGAVAKGFMSLYGLYVGTQGLIDTTNYVADSNTSSTGNAAAMGAASGAAIGTAILPGWGTLIGAALGGIYGTIGGLTASKKGQDQMRRDYYRKGLEDSGIIEVDKSNNAYNLTLADGTKFDVGKDGKSTYTNAAGETRRTYDIDFKDPLQANNVPSAGLFAIATGLDPSLKDFNQFSRSQAQVLNAGTSNAKTDADVDANFRAMLQKGNVTPDQVLGRLEVLRQNNKITEQEYGVYLDRANRIMQMDAKPPDRETVRKGMAEHLAAKKDRTKGEDDLYFNLTDPNKMLAQQKELNKRQNRERQDQGLEPIPFDEEAQLKQNQALAPVRRGGSVAEDGSIVVIPKAEYKSDIDLTGITTGHPKDMKKREGPGLPGLEPRGKVPKWILDLKSSRPDNTAPRDNMRNGGTR